MAKKRHSVADQKHIQGMHDSASALGADCAMGNVAWPTLTPYESAGVREGASLPMNQSHSELHGHLRNALMLAHGVSNTYDSRGPYISDTFNKDVVYQHGGSHFRRPYTIDHSKNPPTVKLGDAVAVHRAYVDVANGSKESMGAGWLAEREDGDVIITDPFLIECVTDLGADFEFKVQEAASSVGGNIPVKLIAPGWGATGYYSSEMLKRDGPKVFTKGLHMYMNHQTAKEEKDRPEGDMNNLAAVLTENARWEDKGAAGPGLYASFKPFSSHEQQIKEKGAFTGVSIRAYATNISEGEAEGKKGKIIEGFSRALSTDFVTRAGAGGRTLVAEGERRTGPQLVKESVTMTEQETATLRATEAARDKNATDLAAAVAETSRLRAEANQAIATAAYIEVFRAKGLELSVEAAKVVAANPPLTKEGAVDLEAIKKVAEGMKPVKKGAAGVRSLGEGATDTSEEAQVKESLKDLGGILKDGFGLTEAAVKVATGQRGA